MKKTSFDYFAFFCLLICCVLIRFFGVRETTVLLCVTTLDALYLIKLACFLTGKPAFDVA